MLQRPSTLRLGTALVALAVVLSGCVGSIVGGGGGGGSQTPDDIVSSHVSEIREAGGYTVNISIVQNTSKSDATASAPGYFIQKTDLETGEQYIELKSARLDLRHYSPPNSKTVYANSSFGTRKVSAERRSFFNLTNVSNILPGNATDTLAAFLKASDGKSGSTELGPATVYVIDSIEEMPPGARKSFRMFDEIKSIQYRLYIDKDTGVIAKFDYRVEAVESEEVTITGGWELVSLGRPDIEDPEWVPEGRLTANRQTSLPAAAARGT